MACRRCKQTLHFAKTALLDAAARTMPTARKVWAGNRVGLNRAVRICAMRFALMRSNVHVVVDGVCEWCVGMACVDGVCGWEGTQRMVGLAGCVDQFAWGFSKVCSSGLVRVCAAECAGNKWPVLVEVHCVGNQLL